MISFTLQLVYFIGIFVVLLFVTFLTGLQICIFVAKQRKRIQRKTSPDEISVGFFHPYCNAGGGGERVLWCAIRALQNKYPNVRCVVYTGDCDATEEEILANAKRTFNISLPKKIQFIYVKKRPWVEAYKYPVFTLLGQSLGSLLLGYEAFSKFIPDVYLDTMGYAFTFFIFKYIGCCKIGCYVHYPTISTDMLSVVSDQTGSFNNRKIIARSSILTKLKLIYYKLFASFYGYAGSKADVVMVNSSWTKNHIENLWHRSNGGRKIHKIFPPCDITEFLQIPIERPCDDSSDKIVLSIGQFRPEKNHPLQVKSFAKFLSTVEENERHLYQLVLVGGCRNEGDRARVDELESLATQLGISDRVSIKINAPFEELKELLSKALVGMHTMTNEHFGIGVVEFQASGVIALAHDSGGPKIDIVSDVEYQDHGQCSTGFLADDVDSYAKSLDIIFRLSNSERSLIGKAARQACERFSENHFENNFINAVSCLLDK